VLNAEFLVYYKHKPANKGKQHPLAIFSLKGAVLEEETVKLRRSSVLEVGELIDSESETLSPMNSGEFIKSFHSERKQLDEDANSARVKFDESVVMIKEQFKHSIALKTADAQLVLCANDEEERREWVRSIKLVSLSSFIVFFKG
jgi:hypothetical protein